MRVAVVSSCYGGYDTPQPPTRQDTYHEVEFIMVTDGPEQWPGWYNIYEPRPHLHPNVAAKYAKMFPQDYAVLADYTIWVDAGSTFSPRMVERVLAKASSDEWVMYRGTRSSKLIEEVGASRTMEKYAQLPLEQQASHYLNGEYPDDQLWGTGIIGRSRWSNQLLGNSWLAEIVRWGFQDQISFAYLRWLYSMHPIDLGPPDGFTSDIIQFADHTSKPLL